MIALTAFNNWCRKFDPRTVRDEDINLFKHRDTIRTILQSALDQQKTAEPCGDLVAKVEHLHNLFCYGIDHATQARERQTIIDRLVDLCEKSHPFKREIIAALKQPAAPTQIDAAKAKQQEMASELLGFMVSKGWLNQHTPEQIARAHLSKLSGGV